ncbi:hypothetical protein E2C01_022361 [Portunus trituberculatus]|uniref:Uncharacterized protein n=1 Tax=Portunus trituberculatus TaxID=210409 RepID=A0A5B7E578_PORTR|nr:hypothetical protein [Portunus trituberculatus]
MDITAGINYLSKSIPCSDYGKIHLRQLSHQGGTWQVASNMTCHVKMNIQNHMKPFTLKWRGTSHVPCATCHATQDRTCPLFLNVRLATPDCDAKF